MPAYNRSVSTKQVRLRSELPDGNPEKVRNAIYPNDWAFSLDLTDVYLHVPIHKQSHKFLRFSLNGQIFQFKALAFGLSTSPFVFSYLMNIIATFLRKRAIILHPYLDDWLARNQCRRTLLEHRHYLTSPGLIINNEKSDLVPTQTFTFIGMEFLSNLNIVSVPQNRIKKILQALLVFSQETFVSASIFLSVLGQLNAAADHVVLGRLQLRPL